VSWLKIQICLKSFSLKLHKTSRKKILFSFYCARQRLPPNGVRGRLFSPEAPQAAFPQTAKLGDFTQA
jgi:hypothetical protein